jgi:hypothetical protein
MPNRRGLSALMPSLAACAVCAALMGALGGCGTAPAEPVIDASQAAQAQCSTTVVLGRVGALAKSNAIALSKLIIQGVSAATPPDTIRDTSSVSGNSQVTVSRVFTLKPLRNWTLTAKALDAKDSVIHQGSTASFYVKPADTAVVSLNLASRFAMYQANFNSLPDSIASTAAGTGKDALKIKRVVMKLDGVSKGDSSVATQFSGGQNVSVFFDYVAIGTHSVALEAYGDLNTFSGLLYSGTTTFSVSAGADDTKSVTLAWVGPSTGSGRISVTLGKVGKVTLNGTLPGTLLLKGTAL